LIQPKSKPKVSVCVTTYNQEPYIRECLQSILDQETGFDFEVIVGDDRSTDGTSAIVREFAERYPGKVIAVLRTANIGAAENYRSVLRTARGEYVAYLDGDDYALPTKLARQAMLLDSAPDCTAVFHQLRMVDGAGCETGKKWPEGAPDRIGTRDLLVNHPIFGHSSMMYRNGLLEEFLSDSAPFVDFMVYTHLSLKGEIAYLDRSLGVYRVGVGVSKNNYRLIPMVLPVFDFAEARGVPRGVTDTGRAKQLLLAAHNALYLRDTEAFRELIERSVGNALLGPVQMVFYALRHNPGLLLAMHGLYVEARRRHLVPELKRKFRGRAPG
jgi:glycosyltransferase involved in cell wall biosynthesis